MSTPSVLIWKKEKNKILNYMAIAKKKKNLIIYDVWVWKKIVFEIEGNWGRGELANFFFLKKERKEE